MKSVIKQRKSLAVIVPAICCLLVISIAGCGGGYSEGTIWRKTWTLMLSLKGSEGFMFDASSDRDKGLIDKQTLDIRLGDQKGLLDGALGSVNMDEYADVQQYSDTQNKWVTTREGKKRVKNAYLRAALNNCVDVIELNTNLADFIDGTIPNEGLAGPGPFTPNGIKSTVSNGVLHYYQGSSEMSKEQVLEIFKNQINQKLTSAMDDLDKYMNSKVKANPSNF